MSEMPELSEAEFVRLIERLKEAGASQEEWVAALEVGDAILKRRAELISRVLGDDA